jgi:radical SAM superfamily enzyme YgiQ (UPF0313 family)
MTTKDFKCLIFVLKTKTINKMSKQKLQIIVLFQNLAEEGRFYYAKNPAPPLSGALVAALTPPIVEVELLHEMIRPINYETDADIIALSFMDYCSKHAIEVARKFKKLGKTVIAGGRYPSTFPEKMIPYFDATVVGEAELIWARVVEDAVKGKLEKVYYAPKNAPLINIPPPRYDLVEPQFAVPIVTEATRGCPFRCSFCQLTVSPMSYRKRPIQDVIRDLTSTEKLPFHKRKVAMILDNNLGGDRQYAKELLKEVAKLKMWGLGVQFSFDCLQDEEFVDLLSEANCRMAFIGMESINEPSLAGVHKKQNKVEEYKELFTTLRKRGILTFTGFIVGLDEDTRDYYHDLQKKVDDIDPSALLTSIAIPIPGTPFHDSVNSEGRIFDEEVAHYEGDHVLFNTKNVTPEEVIDTYKKINKSFYSWNNIIKRWVRFVKDQRHYGSLINKIFRTILASAVLFKLSIFQRDHAYKKVFPVCGEYIPH